MAQDSAKGVSSSRGALAPLERALARPNRGINYEKGFLRTRVVLKRLEGRSLMHRGCNTTLLNSNFFTEVDYMYNKDISKMVSFRLPIVDYAKLASISYRLYGTYNISKTIKLLIYSFLTDYDKNNL